MSTPPTKKIIPLMPKMDLAPGDLREGSPEWMRAFVKEHGSTNPLKIERRRKRISANVDVFDKSIEKALIFRKAALAEISKAIKQAEAAVAAEKDPHIKASCEQYILGLKAQKLAQEVELTDRIEQKIFNFSVVECLCLIVDSLTIRATVESKTGKKGFRRYSVAGMTSEVGVDTEFAVGLWRMIAKHLHPNGVPPEFDPDSDTFRKDDDAAIEDDDILSEDEERDIENRSKMIEDDK